MTAAQPRSNDSGPDDDVNYVHPAVVRDQRRTSPVMLVVAVGASVAPVLVAAIRGARRGWLPTMDNGYTAIRTWDVFSTHPPLTGVVASPSVTTRREIYQPGALNYDLFAVPVRLLGRGWGIALAVALVNVVAVVVLAWLLHRRVGPVGATVGVAAVALLEWSMGSEVLYDPWVTHATLLPFALFLVAAWSVTAGDVAGLVPFVVAGSYASQFHLSFVLPVAGMVAATTLVVAVRLWRRRRRDPAAWPGLRARALRWGALTVGVGLVCWAQPLVDQLPGNGEGNLLALYRASQVDLPTPGLADVVRVFGSTVALPPFWLPPSFASPPFDPDGSGRPLWLAVAGLLVVVGLLAGLGWRAWRRGSTDLAAGAVTGLAGLVFGLLTVARMPDTFGIVPYYLRFMWPLAAIVWLVVVLAVLDELRARDVGLLGLATPGRIAGVAAAATVVVAALTLPTTDNGAISQPWSFAAVNALAPDVVAAVEDEGPVVVDIPISWPSLYVGPPLMGELQEAGVPFRTSSRIVSRQAGFHHEAAPGEAALRLSVRGGPVDPLPGEELVAAWSSLSRAERAELDRLTADLAAVIAAEGIRLDGAADEALDALRLDDVRGAIEAGQDEPDELLAGPTLWAMVCGDPATYVGRSLVVDTAYPPGLLDRWAEVAERRDIEQVAVYLGPEPPLPAWPGERG